MSWWVGSYRCGRFSFIYLWLFHLVCLVVFSMVIWWVGEEILAANFYLYGLLIVYFSGSIVWARFLYLFILFTYLFISFLFISFLFFSLFYLLFWMDWLFACLPRLYWYTGLFCVWFCGELCMYYVIL